METAESLGAEPGGEVKMGNVSLELPIIVRSAVRLFSAVTGLVLPVKIKQLIICSVCSRKVDIIKANLFSGTQFFIPIYCCVLAE